MTVAARPTSRRRPTPAKTLRQIRKMGYQDERQRQLTNGWYARGSYDERGGWKPQPGTPADVFVLLPMGAPYEREHYPEKGFRPLSSVPNKNAIAGRTTGAEFRVEPPEYEELIGVMALMAEAVPEAVRRTEAEIAEINEQLADTGALMKGEAPQLRRARRVLEQRIVELRDPATFEAWRYYEAFVEERKSVVRAQMKPDVVHAAELDRELREWDEHMAQMRAAVEPPTTDSTSSSRPSMKSTPRAAASGES